MRLITKRLMSWIDIPDCVFILGLGLMGYGLWRVYELAAFIGTGGLLVGLVLVPRLSQRRKENAHNR
jgi:hypothetical protein